MKTLIVATLAAALLPQSASAALIGLYQFNDTADLGRDSSGADKHAVNNGATFAKAGFQGGAASLGGGSWLSVPTSVHVVTRPKLTWGAWVKPAVGGGSQQAVLSSDDGDFDRQLMIDSRGTTAWSSLTGAGVLSSGIAPSTNTWTFLAAVYDQSVQKMTFYVNDQSFSSATTFGASRDLFTIGRNASFAEFFSGLVDNVFVYDEALTVEQVANIRTNGFPVSGVPESGTWVMLMAGFGLMGAMARRKPALARSLR